MATPTDDTHKSGGLVFNDWGEKAADPGRKAVSRMRAQQAAANPSTRLMGQGGAADRIRAAIDAINQHTQGTGQELGGDDPKVSSMSYDTVREGNKVDIGSVHLSTDRGEFEITGHGPAAQQATVMQDGKKVFQAVRDPASGRWAGGPPQGRLQILPHLGAMIESARKEGHAVFTGQKPAAEHKVAVASRVPHSEMKLHL